MSDTTSGLTSAIEEMKKVMKDQEDSLVNLRGTAQTFFSALSILIALITAVRAAFLSVDPVYSTWYIAGLIGSGLLYLAFVVVTIQGMRPVAMVQPFPRDYQILTDSLCKPEADRLAMQLSAYLKAIECNQPIVVKKVRLVTTSAILLAVDVIVLLVMSFIPTTIV